MRVFFSLVMVSFSLSLNAQVGIGTTAPSSAAVLYLEALNPVTTNYGGFLMPVVTEAQQAVIPVSTSDNTDDGLMVYVSDSISGKRCWDVYDGQDHIWRSINCNNLNCTGEILYQENFDSYVDGSGVSGISSVGGDYPSGVANWSLTSFESFGSSMPDLPGTLVDGNDYAHTSGGELEFRDTNGAFQFLTSPIAISGYNDIQISIDVRATGVFEYIPTDHKNDYNCGVDESDFIDIAYSLDNGSTFIELPNYSSLGTNSHTIVFDTATVGLGSDGNPVSVTQGGISGNTMIVRILVQNWADGERIFIDNILVSCN